MTPLTIDFEKALYSTTAPVTVAVGRDPAALAAGIGRWLGARRGVDGVEVTRCEAADGGLSSDTLMVDAAAGSG